MTTQESIEALEALLKRAQDPRSTPGGSPFAIVPNDERVADLEPFMANPARRKGNPQFIQSRSFVLYVNEQKFAPTRIYATSKTQIVAVIDHHGDAMNGAPNWGHHRATLNLTHSAEWKTWAAKNNTRMNQRDFAQFIEDNADEVSNPSGAEMLDLVRSIKASCNLECTGDIEEKRGNESGSFTLTTKSKAGIKGELELPSEFLLSMPYYEGESPQPLRARLRFSVDSGRLWLWYELVRIERFEKAALDNVIAFISSETEIDVWHGTPTD